MSRSSSMGDLVPRDITDILALQCKVSKGKNKRGSSLGRAFSWFKGSKQTRNVSNGQSHSGSLRGRTGEDTTIRQTHTNQDSSKAEQNQEEQRKLTVHYTTSQHYQENVFIHSSRPKYLEDLHIEAQEGLKILQQEEHNNGMNLQDDHTGSRVIPNQDSNCQERAGLLGFDNTGDYSITAAMSSHPVLTRQGSTFKPLNSVKKLDKSRKRNRRTTILGIPQHVQREICMEKGVLLRQRPDPDDSDTVIIPPTVGRAPITNYEGARIHLQDIEALQEFRDEQLLRHHIQTVYKDDMLGPRMSPIQRPKSLAIPGMITSSSFLQEPQGPVMSISPQATYLSKIIPNAILPGAIDVIEIDRGRSRHSVRRVSKSSVASVSPGSSHSGGGTRNEPSPTSSNQSHSQSSETIVSNSSTISLKINVPPSYAIDCMKEVSDLNHVEQVSIKSSGSWLSSTSKAGSQNIEQEEMNDDGENSKNGQFLYRSLSVLKPKLPPAPPMRTYSLHPEKIKRSEITETKYLNNLEYSGRQTDGGLNVKDDPNSAKNEKMCTVSPISTFLDESHTFLTSSPHSPDQESACAQTETSNSSSENKFERTMSPSSGYSSQSGTPTHSSKGICTPSPGKQKIKLPKPERMGAQTSPMVSVSSSMASLSSVVPGPVHQIIQTHINESHSHSISIAVTTVNNNVPPPPSTAVPRELFNIPPPPKVKAPFPPPPETWAHNKRTIELLCGPPLISHRIFELQQQEQEQQQQFLLVKNQNTSNVDQTSSERQPTLEVITHLPGSETNNDSMTALEVTLAEHLALGHMEGLPGNEKGESSEREKASYVIQTQKQNIFEKKSPINSKKVQAACNIQQTVQLPTQQLKSEECEINVPILPENHTLTLKTDITVTHNKELQNHMPTQNLDPEVPVVNSTTPPPSPTPGHPPPLPPSKTCPTYSTSMPSPEKELHCEKELPILECPWPPPPPPMNESADLLFDGQDEIEFPPPPPLPLIRESLSDRPYQCQREKNGQTDSMPPKELYDALDIASYIQQNPDLIVNTMREKTTNKPVNPVLSVPKVSDKLFDQTHDKLQFFGKICTDLVCSKMSVLPEISASAENAPLQQLSEENSPLPQGDSSNTSAMSAADLSQLATSDAPAFCMDMPTAPSLPMEDQSTINFRRQSVMNKDSRSKEPLSKNKSAPIPKEDANIPLVTPSLLQMVRLRSVNAEDEVITDSQSGKAGRQTASDQNLCLSSQIIPQKPIRKSCPNPTLPSVKSSPATPSAPSMRLQEAIRMKTAAMSSSGHPLKINLRLSTLTTNTNDINVSNNVPISSPKTTEDSDLHKSPASTASFIFSKSTKKVAIETSAFPEGQTSIRQNLAAELMQVTDQAKSMVINGTKKHVKVPPPVAKKPAHATNLSDKLGTTFTSSNKQKNGRENIGQAIGQCAHSPGKQMPTSKN
ncbi:uncharacterized protein KIAA1522 homolog isoform X2 [Electrophorus electricus]|uniref:uncharacterized protein KIAA1522 homolog isoform X2 n=1 Tax=Electrophorus electricus TaxID=8005 RepID=UPI0015D08D18|nr:uncharacterized protein KIAA1522 homolog isoform X2 [Electrophorus electricus]